PRRVVVGCSGLAEDAVQLGAADRADALSHATTRLADLHLAGEVALLLALHAVSVSGVALSHRSSSIGYSASGGMSAVVRTSRQPRAGGCVSVGGGGSVAPRVAKRVVGRPATLSHAGEAG